MEGLDFAMDDAIDWAVMFGMFDSGNTEETMGRDCKKGKHKRCKWKKCECGCHKKVDK